MLIDPTQEVNRRSLCENNRFYEAFALKRKNFVLKRNLYIYCIIEICIAFAAKVETSNMTAKYDFQTQQYRCAIQL